MTAATRPEGTPPSVRSSDAQTSIDAAKKVERVMSDLQVDVLNAIKNAGFRGMTDRELEQLPWFSDRAPSTIRKRRSDLYHWRDANDEPAPKVVAKLNPDGTTCERDGLTVWVLA